MYMHTCTSGMVATKRLYPLKGIPLSEMVVFDAVNESCPTMKTDSCRWSGEVGGVFIALWQ